MNTPANAHPVLALEVGEPLTLPNFCVCCGQAASHRTRVDVGAGDSATEIKNALSGAAGLVSARTVSVPCCRPCARRLNIRTLLAASLVLVGLGMIGLVAAIDQMVVAVPEEVWMTVIFVAIMTCLFGPVFVGVRFRDRFIPVKVWRLSGGRLRYVFYSDLFATAFRQSPPAG